MAQMCQNMEEYQNTIFLNMFVTYALRWIYKRILMIVVITILYCNGIFLENTAAIIWGMLHYVILNSTFYYPVSSVIGTFVNIFLKI